MNETAFLKTNNIFDKFVTPLLEAKFGGHKHRVSAAWLLGRIKFRGQRDFLKGEVLGYINGGFVELIDTLIGEIGQENIITGAFVEEIIVENGRVVRPGARAQLDTELCQRGGTVPGNHGGRFRHSVGSLGDLRRAL